MTNTLHITYTPEGFKSIKSDATPYDKAFEGTFNEMRLRNTNDEDINVMSEVNRSSIPFFDNNYAKYVYLYGLLTGTGIYTFNTGTKYGYLLKLSKSNGKYDFKPILKKITSSFFHKNDLNKFGKPATVLGTIFPGDNEYIYDHDLWSNIHFGYATKAADFSQELVTTGAITHDVYKVPLPTKIWPQFNLVLKYMTSAAKT